MPVKIRLQRKGRRQTPSYHIVVADARAPKSGKFIEVLGTYNPMTVPATIDLDREKAYTWLNEGAQPSDTANAILRFKGVLYRKHLMRGVSKGAITSEKADQMYQDWISAKEAKLSARKTEEKGKRAYYLKIANTITEDDKNIVKIEEELISGRINVTEFEEENLETEIGAEESVMRFTINGKFEEFTIEKQKEFIQNLREFLKTKEDIQILNIEAVSYTHLTLPTICSV